LPPRSRTLRRLFFFRFGHSEPMLSPASPYLAARLARCGWLRRPLSGERPAGLRTTRAEPIQPMTAPFARQGLVWPVKKLLNVVGSCEIRGRLRCAASPVRPPVHSQRHEKWKSPRETNLSARRLIGGFAGGRKAPLIEGVDLGPTSAGWREGCQSTSGRGPIQLSSR
jgi:hypothetical protein